MATTSSVAGSTSTTSSSTATASARLSNNFDTFLQLLTTQLRNQDPTQPMDANQFTQQLVQYSQVEQQLKTNDYLSALVTANANAAQVGAGLLSTLLGLGAFVGLAHTAPQTTFRSPESIT